MADEKIKCPTCGRTLGKRAFYVSQSEAYKAIGNIPFCKDCIANSFKKSYDLTHNIRQSIIATSMSLNIPFDDRNIVPFVDSEETTSDEALTVFYEYIKMTNSVGRKILSKTSFDYEGYVGKVMQLEDNKEELDEDEKLFFPEEDDVFIDKSVIRFFGNGYTKKEYQSLLKSFLALIQSFDCPNSAMEMVFKDLAFLDMKIESAKINSSPEESIMKLMDGRRKLFKDANIELNERKASDNIEGIGVQTKRMEKTRPASDPLPEWESSKLHQMGKLIAGHLMMAEGVQNEVVEEYQEIVKPYTVDIDEIIKGSENNE